jgi:hypothetical protein
MIHIRKAVSVRESGKMRTRTIMREALCEMSVRTQFEATSRSQRGITHVQLDLDRSDGVQNCISQCIFVVSRTSFPHLRR